MDEGQSAPIGQIRDKGVRPEDAPVLDLGADQVEEGLCDVKGQPLADQFRVAETRETDCV